MTVRAQWAVVAGVVALLAGGLTAATRMFGDELFPVSVGSDAPNFKAAALEKPDTVKSLADYKGEVVLLNLWATWCGPCRVEMPSIEALHRDFGPKGLKVVAVSIDQPGAEEAIREFLRARALTFEVLYDSSGEIQRTYQTSGVPETFLIGRDGVIRKKHLGITDWNSAGNRALVARLLAEPAS